MLLQVKSGERVRKKRSNIVRTTVSYSVVTITGGQRHCVSAAVIRAFHESALNRRRSLS